MLRDARNAGTLGENAVSSTDFALFDAHFHIIDPRFPCVPNAGYLPDPFTCDDYRKRMQGHRLAGGAVVAGSFQGTDQEWLIAALETLGPGFAGVAQASEALAGPALARLDAAGVRALRFNLRRGGGADATWIETLARRCHERRGWHAEFYAAPGDLAALSPMLMRLPAVVIDHLGLAADTAGLNTVLRLAEAGARIKASGFGRLGDEAAARALRAIHAVNPRALMFGTDLPSTRAPRPYRDEDFQRVPEVLGEDAARAVFSENALECYRITAA